MAGSMYGKRPSPARGRAVDRDGRNRLSVGCGRPNAGRNRHGGRSCAAKSHRSNVGPSRSTFGRNRSSCPENHHGRSCARSSVGKKPQNFERRRISSRPNARPSQDSCVRSRRVRSHPRPNGVTGCRKHGRSCPECGGPARPHSNGKRFCHRPTVGVRNGLAARSFRWRPRSPAGRRAPRRGETGSYVKHRRGVAVGWYVVGPVRCVCR